MLWSGRSFHYIGIPVLALVLAFTAVSSPLRAQVDPVADSSAPAAASISAAADGGSEHTKNSVIRWGILGGTSPVTFFFGVKAWDWNGNHDPFTEKEGWFQQST
ncbi:MAG: hypothetical protein ACRCUT_04975, partial [Spirochaetota bacterium]